MSVLSSPTGIHAKAYLATAWKNRNQLSKYESRGLSQFLYIVTFSHLENVISQIVRARLSSIKNFVLPKEPPTLNLKQPDNSEILSLSPALGSINQLLVILERECENAPLNVAANIFSKLFPSGISKYIGSNLNHDLEAIKDLRNIFAHGKDIVIRFDGTFEDGYHVNSEDTVLHRPLSRLKAAGLIDKVEITGRNHIEYYDLLYSEEAMKYFYDSVIEIEKELTRNCLMAHEIIFVNIPELPELFA